MKYFLIGYMGSGKTTVGKELARILNLPFFDTDEIIERLHNKSIADIFVSLGEKTFREIEQSTLENIVENYPNGVFSTGGGMPCYGQNMKLMNQHGTSVFINCGVKLLTERLSKSRDRPLVQGKSEKELLSFIKSHIAERKPFYNQAAIKVMGHHRPNNIARRIIKRVENLDSLRQK